MHVKGGAAIVPNVIKAVEVARSRQIPIIWVSSFIYLFAFYLLKFLNFSLQI